MDNFVPSCVVCKHPVPLQDADRRNRETCSAKCAETWRRYRAYLVSQTHCPSCYHPCTPAERADFREWRLARGTLHAKSGRPVLTSDQKLRSGVQKAILRMRSADVNGLVSLADELQTLLDQNPIS